MIASEAQILAGWNISEAIMRFADPGVVEECCILESEWIAGGRRRHFRKPKDPRRHGGVWAHLNAIELAAKRVYERYSDSWSRVRRPTLELLKAGKLPVFARRDSPSAPFKAIPASACRYLRIESESRSVLVERTRSGVVRFYDVRIVCDNQGMGVPFAEAIELLEKAGGDQELNDSKPTKRASRTQSKSSSEKACTGWLARIMAESPDKPIETKEYWRAQALTKWPGTLSVRGFARAWKAAVDLSGAHAWEYGGRRRES